MRETRFQSLGQEDPLEKEMATHSSILAWKIPWMEEPGWLLSMGSQRVGQDWATLLPIYLTYLLSLAEKLLELVVKITLSSFPLFVLFLTPSKELCVHSIEMILIQVSSDPHFAQANDDFFLHLIGSQQPWHMDRSFFDLTLSFPGYYNAKYLSHKLVTPHQPVLLTDPLFTQWMWEKFFSFSLTPLPWLITLSTIHQLMTLKACFFFFKAKERDGIQIYISCNCPKVLTWYLINPQTYGQNRNISSCPLHPFFPITGNGTTIQEFKQLTHDSQTFLMFLSSDASNWSSLCFLSSRFWSILVTLITVAHLVNVLSFIAFHFGLV